MNTQIIHKFKQFFSVCFCCLIFCHPIELMAQSGCKSCASVKQISFPELTIMETTAIDEEKGYCKVLGTIGKEINFELLLPDEWNSRFVMGGGGGFVGTIQNVARSKVKEGYATVGTDTGHKGPGLKADWAYHNMERQLNFGHLAVHRTALVAKAIISDYYCEAPEYSYFIGCSRGGGQALIEAQRYPEDFDGIVAEAPIIDWPATGAEMVQNTKILYPQPENIEQAVLSQHHLQLLQDAVLEQCDEIDGLADQIINDPRDCNFDFTKLPSCNGIAKDKSCFTTAQVAAIKTIYRGPTNQNGQIYPGFPLGCENAEGGWFPWIVGPSDWSMNLNFPSLQFAFGTEMFKYLIYHDPDWNYATYDFSTFHKDTRFAASFLNATNTDYSAFKARGGKMIIWHGWGDPALSALTAIEHYEEAKKKDQQLMDYIRLFLLPGVTHCGGGPGPDRADWLEVVREWVEKGTAPKRVVVSKVKNEKVEMSRPVFPYPAKAAYSGNGDPNRESSFVKKK